MFERDWIFEGMMTLAPSDARPNINSFRVWAGISEISVGFMAFEEGRKWDPVIQKKKTLLTNCSFDVDNQITDDSRR